MKNSSIQKTAFIQTHAPAKLFFSGEHAVVYGAPALGMSLNHFVTTTTLSQSKSNQILLKLKNFQSEHLLEQEMLHALKQKIDARYAAFQKGSILASKILEPMELLPYLLALYAEQYQVLYEGLEIEVVSTIPMGFGLGSSASSIVSLLRGLSLAFIPISSDKHFVELAHQAENLVHGRSSGFDVELVFRKGCFYREQGHYYPCPFPEFSLQLVDTGVPEVGTAECVQAAAPVFDSSPSLITQFSEVTCALREAIKGQNQPEFQRNIAKNHRLLCDIGVVPDKVQACIADIEKRGNSAKICGAGASRGDKAGVLLMVGEYPVSDILAAYEYRLFAPTF